MSHQETLNRVSHISLLDIVTTFIGFYSSREALIFRMEKMIVDEVKSGLKAGYY